MLKSIDETEARKIGELAASLVSQRDSAPKPAIQSPISEHSRVPAAFVREIDRDIPDRVVAWYENGQELIKPNLRRALSHEERGALTRRRNELQHALAAPHTGRHGDRCASAVSGMLSAFPLMARLDLETAVATVGGYMHTVRNYPPWAVIEACEHVRSGAAGINRSFCPSEPDFCELVRKIVWPWELQLRKTEALLSAELPNAEPKRQAAQPPSRAVKPDTGYARRAIIDRIRKLWALGTDNPNAAEAASAKERALALMEQHNILPSEFGPAPSVFELDPENWEA
jgi:hypothetical protein